MVSSKDFDNEMENKWCPGCGNFPILKSMKEAFAQMGLEPRDLLLISGIGQAGKTPNFLQCNMFHTLHGRALAVATGAKIANKNLNIVVNSGDGDCYGEGGNHFLTAVRRNIDVTLLVHNNKVYGLTKGQASPTSDYGMTTKAQPKGTQLTPFNALATALVSGAGFVARGFSGDTDMLCELIVKAFKYKGFSMIDILQPCVSFNKINTLKWYKQRVYDLQKNGHDPSDLKGAIELVLKDEEKEIPLGVIYENETLAYHERIEVLKDSNLFDETIESKKLKKSFSAVKGNR
jgi:2-oxoglutarate ferredoxin oxidoreductase subunit beta